MSLPWLYRAVGSCLVTILLAALPSGLWAQSAPAPAVGTITPPKALNMLEYRRAVGYPPKAKKAGIEGEVQLNVLVDRNGKVISHKVLSSKADPLLIRAVIEKLPMLSYTPAMKDGKPVAQNTTLAVKFRLP